MIPAQMNLVLAHDGHRWWARSDDLQVSGETLDELESRLQTSLHDSAPVNVRLRFDLCALPRWLHQYQAHYFNYLLKVRRQG